MSNKPAKTAGRRAAASAKVTTLGGPCGHPVVRVRVVPMKGRAHMNWWCEVCHREVTIADLVRIPNLDSRIS